MLFLYRTAMDNEFVKEEDKLKRSAIFFYDTKTHERFIAKILSVEVGQPIGEYTANGNKLFSSTSVWEIETEDGKKYTRKAEHRTSTDIFYPEGWDHRETISSPVALFVVTCTKTGSVRVGIDCDSWMEISRGDMGV